MNQNALIPHIQNLKNELDKLRPLDRAVELAVMQKLRLDWNFHSNHLEGNTLTYGETKALILFGITAQGKPLKDHFEITGHDEAVKWVEEVVKEDRPLTENFIRELHKLILKEPYQKPAISPDGTPTQKWVHIGQYKTESNHVLTVTNEIFRFASPEETPALMNDLIDWYRTAKADPTHEPLLLAAEFHYRFIRIHPFDDGNGRTARILMNFVLMQAGYPPVIIKTEDKQNYFAALRQADAGLLVPFVEYIGQNLVRSLELMLKGAQGQRIDDPDDIDKEIALLEQKLKMTNEKVEKRWSHDTFAELTRDVIRPLFEAFMAEAKKLDKFYGEINSFFEYNDELHEIIEIYSLETQLLALAIELYLDKEQGILNSVGCVTTFSKFNVKNNDHSFMSIIKIQFYDDYYEIVCGEQQIERLYHQTLSDSEIKDIVDAETKRHIEAIKKQIAKNT